MSRMKSFQTQKDDGYDFCSLTGPCFQLASHVQLKEQASTGEEFLLKVKVERDTIPSLTKYKDYNMEECLKNQILNMPEVILALLKLVM